MFRLLSTDLDIECDTTIAANGCTGFMAKMEMKSKDVSMTMQLTKAENRPFFRHVSDTCRIQRRQKQLVTSSLQIRFP
jgi:hypothetical protein